MGVFYNTDRIQHTDYIVKLPEQLMLKAVDFYNKGTQTTESLGAKFIQNPYQTFNFAQEDLDKYYTEKYGSKAKQILDELHEKKIDWKQAMKELNMLGYSLTEDSLRGNLAKWTRPYQEYIQKAKEYSGLVKSGNYDEEAFNLWNLHALQRAKENYQYNNGNVNLSFLNEMALPKTYDAGKYLEENLTKKFGELGWSIVRSTPNGDFIVKTKEGYEKYISKDRIYDVAMRLLGFVPVEVKGNDYDIISGNQKLKYQYSELSDVGKYYWNKAYWAKYLEKRNEGLSQDQAKQAAQDYANKYWENVAKNKAWGMVSQLYSKNVFSEQTLTETNTKKVTSGVKVKENIGDLGGTSLTVDFIPDIYFNREKVDENFSSLNNYWKYQGYLNDKDISDSTKAILRNELKTVTDPTQAIEKIEDLYNNGKINYDDYNNLKLQYQAYKKYESAYNASKVYAINEVNRNLNDIDKNIFSFILNLSESGKKVKIATLDDGSDVYFYVEGDKLVTENVNNGIVSNKRILLDGDVVDVSQLGLGINKLEVSKFKSLLNNYYSKRDEWFKKNKDAASTEIYALDISTIDGNNFALSKRLGRRVFANANMITPVDPQNNFAAVEGEFSNAANKVINNLKSVFASVKVDKNGNISFADQKGNSIASYVTVTKVFTAEGEQYMELYVNKDDKIYNLLGLNKNEIKSLENNKNRIIVHIPKTVDVKNQVLAYMNEYDIKPIDQSASKVLQSWTNPWWDVREKAMTAYHRFTERNILEQEPYGAVSLSTPYGDMIEISKSDSGSIVVEFSNKNGVIEYDLGDIGDEQQQRLRIDNIIDSYLNAAMYIEKYNKPLTEDNIDKFYQLINNGKSPEEAAKSL